MSNFEVTEEWIPAIGARALDDAGFAALLEGIQRDLGAGARVSGDRQRVVMTVAVSADSPEVAEVQGRARIQAELVGLAFIPSDRPRVVGPAPPDRVR
jgi:hypothetical protein